jgi:glutaredoxin
MSEEDELPPIRIRPDEKYKAEVIVLLTSLGVKRREYNESIRAKDLLEVYQVHFKVIDFNLDTNVDDNRVNQQDLDLIKRLFQTKRIMQDPKDGLIILPQIFIDGVNIGDKEDLQLLVDSDDAFENILLRLSCPACKRPRDQIFPDFCKYCDTSFEELMPDRYLIEDALQQYDLANSLYDEENSN